MPTRQDGGMTWTGEWTARGIADEVMSGRVESHAAVAEALTRIADRDGALSAFARVRPQAIDEARVAPGGPLAGVPVAIKDNIPVAGEPMRVGSQATAAEPSTADHPVVSRLRAAGAVPVGITAVPELCIFGTTDALGIVTRNPWNPQLTPGGSSGGSAVAVAAGMVPVAHAADGMGSIRIPAACTGIVGVKPGLGVVPAEMGVNDWFGMSENGVLATTVADAALALSVMANRPEWAAVEPASTRMRVGVSLTPPVPGVRLDAGMGRAATRAASLLKGSGHAVDRVEPAAADVAVTAAAVGALSRWFAGAALDAAELDPALLEPRTRTHTAIGRRVLGTPLLSERLRQMWQESALTLLEDQDLLITPALAGIPPGAVAWSQRSWGANIWSNVQYAPYAAPWNIAGFPAMVVPMGVHPVSGTPIAAQLVGRPGHEALLLSVAALLEARSPWQRVAPGVA